MNTINILNVAIHNLSMSELLEHLDSLGGFVVTPNVDHLMKLRTDTELQEAYRQSDYRVCDSKIVQYASKFLGTPLIEKISGSDLFPAFYEKNREDSNIKIFLLGSEKGIAQQARNKINQKLGREIVIDCHSPVFGFEQDDEECERILEKIRNSGATVLAVGLGAPKQEKWISKYKNQLPNVKIFLAIGATIDFEAGYKLRSPRWMSEAGLEWLHRLFSEPQRLWKRYLIESTPFFWLILKQKLQSIKKTSFDGETLRNI